MEKILIIDDDQGIYTTLGAMIRRMGCEAFWSKTLSQGLAAVKQENYDVVLLDVQMPDGCGLDLITDIRRVPSEPEVIIMTGFGNSNGAEIAVKSGAWDYIQKNASPKDITLSLKQVLDFRREKSQCRVTPVALNVGSIVGESPALKACFDQVARAAAGDANVLISGETGTGKEVFARAIHANSARAKASLVVVDCAALPGTLVESLLFGHEKGAYTGADTTREGLVAQADGGTLFLDEVGEMPLDIQKVFLRVLQEHKFRPVGARQERASDFRLIAATNRDLDRMTAEGHFREDLLYRIRTIDIRLSPLRERTEDINPLVFHYLARICERNRTGFKGVSSDFLETLNRYSWPGNVRELICALETALSNAGPDLTLISRHLPQNIRLHAIQQGLGRAMPMALDQAAPASPGEVFPAALTTFKAFRRAALEKAEKQYLYALVQASGNNVDNALRISGLSRSRFYELLKQHKMTL